MLISGWCWHWRHQHLGPLVFLDVWASAVIPDCWGDLVANVFRHRGASWSFKRLKGAFESSFHNTFPEGTMLHGNLYVPVLDVQSPRFKHAGCTGCEYFSCMVSSLGEVSQPRHTWSMGPGATLAQDTCRSQFAVKGNVLACLRTSII